MLNALFLQLTVPTAPSDDWRADAESADPVQEVNTLFPFLFPFVSILIILCRDITRCSSGKCTTFHYSKGDTI